MKFLILLMVVFLSLFLQCSSRPNFRDLNPCPGVKRSRRGYVLDYVKEGWICCMCNAGTFMQEPCKKGNPSSTVCSKCPFNRKDPENQYYKRRGPHDKRTCMKSQGSCLPGYARIRGTRKRPARCERKFSVSHHTI